MTQPSNNSGGNAAGGSRLTRELGLLGLAATGICSMLGAAINVIPFMIQRSVDGSKIAFVSNRRGEGGSGRGNEIYIMNADGSGQRRVTDRGDVLFSPPTWSPEDTEIAFVSNRSGNPELYLTTVDGTSLTRLTDNPSEDGNPGR